MGLQPFHHMCMCSSSNINRTLFLCVYSQLTTIYDIFFCVNKLMIIYFVSLTYDMYFLIK